MSRFLTTNLGKQTGAYSQCSKTTYEGVASKLSVSEQGGNEARWRPGQEASLAPPMFEREAFRKQSYRIQRSTCDIVGAFRRPGNCDLPSLRPCPQEFSFVLNRECANHCLLVFRISVVWRRAMRFFAIGCCHKGFVRTCLRSFGLMLLYSIFNWNRFHPTSHLFTSCFLYIHMQLFWMQQNRRCKWTSRQPLKILPLRFIWTTVYSAMYPVMTTKKCPVVQGWGTYLLSRAA